jgi:Nif-specific regulatory protein
VPADPLKALVGASPSIDAVRRFIRRVAASDSTVLLVGESGTGKERAARALHAASRRAAGPLVAVNCAALPEALVESELFGHERGAFTGAIARRVGRMEQASGGTLFLDEVGELAASAQAKLLRAVEAREVDRVGGRGPVAVDVRVIAAANRDLEAAVGDGRFREDLYYRLNVLKIRMPALRDRREDIPLLAAYFLDAMAGRAGRRARLSDEALGTLAGYDWPGNVRELANAIEHALVLGNGPVIEADDLPVWVRGGPLEGLSGSGGEAGLYHAALGETKRFLFRAAFARAEGDYRKAALALGLHPHSVHRMVRALDLEALLGGSGGPA